MIYKHTQPGHVMWGFLGASVLLCGILAVTTGPRMMMASMSVGMAVLLILFFSQTVEICSNSLHFWFGPGLIRKRIPLESIISCEPVRNRWIYGWGIHHYGGGWLYNVSGCRAVEIKLASGKCLRIGTDEPTQLRTAVIQACEQFSTI